MNPLTHRQIEELLGAYALDAVDDDERDLIEAHLAGCPRCRAEVATHRETAALLAHPGETAPEGVWSRIAAGLEEPPPEMDMASVVPLDPARDKRDGRSRRAISLRAAGLIGAVAAAVTAFLGWSIGQQGAGVEDGARELVVQDDLRRAVTAALGEPDAEQVRLVSSDGRVGVHVVRLPGGTGFAVADKLAALPPERTYQLWGVTEDATISLGVLGRDPEVAPFHMSGPVLAYAVTEEVAGGVKESTRTPLVIGYTELGEQTGEGAISG